MKGPVVVVGAGIGGLAAALRLARRGVDVRVLEARDGAGGLAAGFELEGLRFDAGPYVLLDRPGLEWALAELGLALEEELALRRVERVYSVAAGAGPPVELHADAGRTAAGIEARWPGAGARYRAFVERAERTYARIAVLQREPRPGPAAVLRTGAWRALPFLLSSLRGVLARSGLPRPVCDALAIWTHVAGQRPEEAPSPMALIPALIHTAGAYHPAGGIGAIAERLAAALGRAGVAVEYGRPVVRLARHGDRVLVAETADGELVTAAAVVSNASGVGTYLELLDGLQARAAERLRRLPLQSPGVCAYLRVRGGDEPPYLRFQVPGPGERCRLLVQPAVVDPDAARDGWRPARLIAPMDHGQAQAMGLEEQRAHLEQLIAEPWWHAAAGEHEVLATRVPVEWGAQFRLHRDAMNPVMTARFMRAGRLAHASPHARGLFLCGSATHPGQWVSFCAVSGVLAADAACRFLGAAP